MIEIISVITSLCLSPNGADSWSVQGYVQRAQLECQQYYVKCVDKDKSMLKDCIMNRPKPSFNIGGQKE